MGEEVIADTISKSNVASDSSDTEGITSDIIPEVTTQEPATPAAINKRKAKPEKPFPSYSIRESIVIARSIKENNGGNPWHPSDIASSISFSFQGNKFFYLSQASRDYGFTIGTRAAKIISIAPLGRKFVYPSSPGDEEQAYQEAFFNIPLFKSVYDHYRNGSLPEIKYLCNTLRNEFNLDEEYHDEFIDIYKKNIEGLVINGTSSEPRKPLTNQPAEPIRPQSSTNTTGEIFVIMPFNEKTDKYSKGFFSEVLSSLIVPAASDAGYTVHTANLSGSDIIHSTIVNEIASADLILADLTEHNPNVLFELGLAIAFEKQVALIRAKGTPPIFDVDNLLRVFDYDPNLWRSTIERDTPNLAKHIQATIKNTDKSYLELLRRS